MCYKWWMTSKLIFQVRKYPSFVTRFLYKDNNSRSQQQALIDMMYRTNKTFESPRVREVEMFTLVVYEGEVSGRSFFASSLALPFVNFSTSQKSHFGKYMIFTTGFLRAGALFFGLRPLRGGVHFLRRAWGVDDSSDDMLSSESDSSSIIHYHFKVCI